jgi:hypothetical protein
MTELEFDFSPVYLYTLKLVKCLCPNVVHATACFEILGGMGGGGGVRATNPI